MTPRPTHRPFPIWRLTLITAIALAVGWLIWQEVGTQNASPSFDPGSLTQRAVKLHSAMPPAEGMNCRACHPRIVAQWEESQHALANRLVPDSPLLPGEAQYGNTTTRISQDLSLRQQTDGEVVFEGSPVAVIGVEPLVQALVDTGGGKWQVFNPAFHPEKEDWFNAFPEVRQPGEWGHWTGRAMNWNSRCAWCHMTDFEKRYDVKTDTYNSTWTAMGIACAQCHGNTEAHAANPETEKAVRFDRMTAQENCMTCHARREFLTAERFQAGDPFNDHFRLALFDQPGVYYPDGQVQDENFEATSFLSSRMHDAGVTCFDCHNAHSGDLILPTENNALCMSCHTAPGRLGAPAILPTAHSHHAEGSTGNRCVECHMAETQYMQSDWRRDHGFHSPDPLMTRELGIPNACTRCHEDQSVDWAVEAAETWHGEKLETNGVRERTRAVAAAREVEPGAGQRLANLMRTEPNAVWRSSMVLLMEPYLEDNRVLQTVQNALKDEHELVRASAVQALRPHPTQHALLVPLRSDESRQVRLNALWATLELGDFTDEQERELREWLEFNQDDVLGRLNLAQEAYRKGKFEDLNVWIERMLDLDPSAGPMLMAGRLLHASGQTEEAGDQFEDVVRRDPDNAEGWYVLAMFRGEQGDLDGALDAFRRTVVLNPEHARAWYNLGLAQIQRGNRTAGLLSLQRAETLSPDSADAPYAAATVYARDGSVEKAVDALRRGLKQQPGHLPSQQLLRRLQSR